MEEYKAGQKVRLLENYDKGLHPELDRCLEKDDIIEVYYWYYNELIKCGVIEYKTNHELVSIPYVIRRSLIDSSIVGTLIIGLCSVELIEDQTEEIESTCNCEIFTLMNIGCQCGGL